MTDDVPQDHLVSHGEAMGWRLEVWLSGFWLDTYYYRVRPALKDDVGHHHNNVTFERLGFQSQDDAQKAALADFREKLSLGQLMPLRAGC